MKLLLVGDVMLGRLVNDALRSLPPEYCWGDTLLLFRQADWRCCNLECVIADRGQPWPDKVFHFRSDARNVAVLSAAGIDAVSLANNHALDYGQDAAREMLALLDQSRIAHAGLGADAAHAFQPAISEVTGLRLGFISFTDNQPEWEAREESLGVCYVPVLLSDVRAQRLLSVVRTLRQSVDIVVVSAHWGPNWGRYPPPEHVPFAHALVDAGADIVVGHSGHAFRGLEIYRGRPVLYCLGNFIDDYYVDEVERNDQSFITEVEIQDRRLAVRLYPTVIREFQACHAGREEGAEIASQMERLCRPLGTATRWDSEAQRLEVLLSPAPAMDVVA